LTSAKGSTKRFGGAGPEAYVFRLPTPKGQAVSQLLQALRDETAPFHRRLETHRLLRRLLARDLAMHEYVAVLEKLYGFYRPLERRLAAQTGWVDLGLDFAERVKTPLLAADLAVLGVRRERLPLAHTAPVIHGLAEAVGCFYVLESSTLGGEVISRHVQRSLGLGASSGLGFFSCYGERVPAMWAEARSAIGAFAQLAPSAGWRAVGAAAEMFSALHDWLGSDEDARERAGVS
jgi:heme oxygenase